VSIALFVAGRYLRSKQREGFFSVIAYMAVGGVILGVAALVIILSVTNRSEERRVGKECRSRWSPYH